jgi:hypothetical protein
VEVIMPQGGRFVKQRKSPMEPPELKREFGARLAFMEGEEVFDRAAGIRARLNAGSDAPQ